MAASADDDERTLAANSMRYSSTIPNSTGRDYGDRFFLRNGFAVGTRKLCEDYARSMFPRLPTAVAEQQGFCSYTLHLGDDRILQFRPTAFNIDMGLISEAKSILADIVPSTEFVGTVIGAGRDGTSPQDVLHVYVMDRKSGITVAEMEHGTSTESDRLVDKKRCLLSCLGAVFATTYISGKERMLQGVKPRKGKVGKSLDWRLGLLQDLPAQGDRDSVDEVWSSLREIEELPWCLTHGDMVPSNVLADPDSGRLRGLIDWAEGESLPFGIGLYGLEELLGMTNPATGLFEYHASHRRMREEFWRGFGETMHKSELDIGNLDRSKIMLARKLGILLWRGIAFENGRIDRVVEQGTDDAELHKLRLFLSVNEPVPAWLGSQCRDVSDSERCFDAPLVRRICSWIKKTCMERSWMPIQRYEADAGVRKGGSTRQEVER